MLRKAVARDAGGGAGRSAAAPACCSPSSSTSSRNFAEAERLVKEALSLEPDSEDEPKLLFVLGRTYVSSGRQAEGVATFEVIVREYPQSPVAAKARETLVNLGQR